MSDLQQVISGFGGFPYKFYDPADCPDMDDWPAGLWHNFDLSDGTRQRKGGHFQEN